MGTPTTINNAITPSTDYDLNTDIETTFGSSTSENSSQSSSFTDSASDAFFTLADNAFSLIVPKAHAEEPTQPQSEDTQNETPNALERTPRRKSLQSASDWMEEFGANNTTSEPVAPEDVPNVATEEFSTTSQEDRMASVDEQLLRQTPQGYNWEPSEHCFVITPAISPQKADEIENPIIRAPFKVAAGVLTGIHKTYDLPLRAVIAADEYTNVGLAGGDVSKVSEMRAARSEIETARLQVRSIVQNENREDGAQYETELNAAKAELTAKETEHLGLFEDFEQYRSVSKWRSWGARIAEGALATVGGSYLQKLYANTSLLDLAKNVEVALPKKIQEGFTERLAILDDPNNFDIDRAQHVAEKKALTSEAAAVKLPLQIEALAAKFGIAPEAVNAMGFRSMSAGMQAKLTKEGSIKFWSKYGLPVGLGLTLSATGIVSEAKKGLEAVEKWTGMEPLTGKQREWAKNGIYASMFLGATALLNSNIKIPYTEMSFKGYQRVVSPSVKPPHAKETKLVAGAALALGLMAETWYLHNVSAQQRILPALHGDDHGTAYWPGNWESEYIQTHTAASRSISWGAFGFVWAALSSWQIGWADSLGGSIGKASQTLQNTKHESIQSLGRKLDWFAATSSDTILTSAEKRWIAEGGASQLTKAMPRSMRSVYVNTFKGKRVPYTALQVLTSFPVGIAIQQAMGYAQDFQSQEALTGTSMRSFLTVPANSATVTYYTSSKGFSTAWDGYKWNMMFLNYPWEQCSMQPEMVFQVAAKIADQYAYAENQSVKDEMEARLVTLYYIAEEGTAERDRIKTLCDSQGIIPEAVFAKAQAREASRLN